MILSTWPMDVEMKSCQCLPPTLMGSSDTIDGPKWVEPMLKDCVTTWVSPLEYSSAASCWTRGAEMAVMLNPTNGEREAAIAVLASSTSQAAVSGSSLTDLRNRSSTSWIGTT